MKEQFKLRVSAKISRWNGDTYPLWQERAAEVELVPGASREDELRAIELLCESMAKALKDVAEGEQEPVKGPQKNDDDLSKEQIPGCFA